MNRDYYAIWLRDVIRAQRHWIKKLFRMKGVITCGVGFKEVGGKFTEELAVCVGVEKKLKLDEISNHDMVPSSVDGVSTDVLEIGKVIAQAPDRARHRPAPGGCSVGHRRVSAGTLGCWFTVDGKPVILSNNHVLANINRGKLGDLIYQPSVMDGGAFTENIIATLCDFHYIRFPSISLLSALRACLRKFLPSIRSETNLVDAALALRWPMEADAIDPAIREIGCPLGFGEPTLGQSVQKFGRTTGYTRGTIDQIHVTVRVDYDGRLATFTNQVLTASMSAGGDSGSVILDFDQNIIGLLFSGSPFVTIITPIRLIRDIWPLRILGSPPESRSNVEEVMVKGPGIYAF